MTAGPATGAAPTPAAHAHATSLEKQEVAFRYTTLALIFVLAFIVRLFSVLRYESVIHEFDPYFNFRSTKYLVSEGALNFHNWFDENSWYPLGRIVGGTIYPGLMWTAATFYWILRSLNITIQIRNVCVFLAPFFASNTAMATYFLTKEIKGHSAGLAAAAFISICPGYISRSVAGSFDNEGIAIFALILTFGLWVRSVNTGSLFWAACTALSYFYMVSAWGGYVYIINLIPLHVLVLIATGRFSERLYIAYTTFFSLGCILGMQITFVGFQHVQSSEHMAALGVFGLLQLWGARHWLKNMLVDPRLYAAFERSIITLAIAVAGVALVAGTATGYISPWTGRFWTLLDPTYAKEHIPIIASVSEHQPTTWSSFFFDLHILTFLFPAGLYFCFSKMSDASLFAVVYGVTSIYFAGVMVRLMLVLAPIMCVLGGIAVSQIMSRYMVYLCPPTSPSARAKLPNFPVQKEIALVVVLGLSVLLFSYSSHCIWVSSEAYSSPSIVLSARQHDGSRVIFDDFRESYRWLAMNTPPDSRIMSWWDYGYQLSAMANRTILVDNNTWNNSHIAEVGKAFALPEEQSIHIMRKMDVNYVLVIFGGMIGYSSDDINKFLWMIRIAGSTDPSIKEADYYSEGEYRIDAGASEAMKNSLMYRLSFYRFGQVYTEMNKPSGFDRVRNAEIGVKEFELKHLEEVFTSEHWMVRLYRVKPMGNRE